MVAESGKTAANPPCGDDQDVSKCFSPFKLYNHESMNLLDKLVSSFYAIILLNDL